MDPASIIGTASAVIGIIDALTKVIATISSLSAQWADADLAVLSFEAQLATLKAGLDKIREWMEASAESPHHQLAIDLDRCLRCCRLLIAKIERELAQLQAEAGPLKAAGKLRLMFKSKEIKEVEAMIGRQTGALTLLLTACNTYGFTVSTLARAGDELIGI